MRKGDAKCGPNCVLQWGRAHVSAEMGASFYCAKYVSKASMGPRSRERGNGLHARAGEAGKAASMGPRSRERGNAACRAGAEQIPKLQWGRAHVSAEICRTSGWQLTAVVLQWGRAHVSAEMR